MRSIVRFPTRYEPLVKTFGEASRNTFIRQENDLGEIARIIKQVKTSGQSKLSFVYADSESGAGKTTFIQSLDLFLPELVAEVLRVSPEKSLNLEDLVTEIRAIPVNKKITVVNVDGHESFAKTEEEYRNFSVQLNTCLRNRDDLLLLWPVNNRQFADRLIEFLRGVAGESIFGAHKIYFMEGLKSESWPFVLDGILKIANWSLEDAALDPPMVIEITKNAKNIGEYLDLIQKAIAEGFDVEAIGFTPPQLVFVISSGSRTIRETCRGLRRADSYYAEASRLLMYTKKSNAAEWWQERSANLKTCLPHVIALFNVQLVTLSASAVVHSALSFGTESLQTLAEGVTRNVGNAKTVIKSTELHRYSLDADVDSREYGSATQEATLAAYARIQSESEKQHKSINDSILKLIAEAEGGFGPYQLEATPPDAKGLIVDAITSVSTAERPIYLEFHHKSGGESTPNKISIYMLDKLKEYSINFGVAPR